MDRQDIDAAFDEAVARKSRLLMEARTMRARGRQDEAAIFFAEAAQMEEDLGARCEQANLLDKAHLHRFSAVGCWAQAGNFYQSIRSGDMLLKRNDLPERLRQRVQAYVENLRRRRAQWYETVEAELADA